MRDALAEIDRAWEELASLRADAVHVRPPGDRGETLLTVGGQPVTYADLETWDEMRGREETIARLLSCGSRMVRALLKGEQTAATDPLPNPLLVPLTRYADALESVARQAGCGEDTRTRLRAAAGLVRGVTGTTHGDGDTCGPCSEVLGSSVCAISHDFRPGAYGATEDERTQAERWLQIVQREEGYPLLRGAASMLPLVREARAWQVEAEASERASQAMAAALTAVGFPRQDGEPLTDTFARAWTWAVDIAHKGRPAIDAPSPLTEAEVRAWADLHDRTQATCLTREEAHAADVALILAVHRGDIPDAVRAAHGGDTCGPCSEVLGSSSPCAISHDFRPGAYDGATVTTTPGHVWRRDASGESVLVPAPPAEMAVTTGEPCRSRYYEVTCEKRGRHDTHGTLDGLNMWTNHATGVTVDPAPPAEMAVTTGGGRIRVGAWRYEPKTGLYTRHDERGLSMCEVYRSAHEERGTGWYRRPFLPPIGVDEEGVVAAMAVCDRALATWADLDTSNDEPGEVKP